MRGFRKAKIKGRLQTPRMAVLFFSMVICSAQNASAQLTNVAVTLGDSTVHESSVHTIQFNKNLIPADGKIVIIYPSGFDLSNVTIVYSEWMDGTWTISSAGDSLTVDRNGDGSDETSAFPEVLQLVIVQNADQVRSDYTVHVRIKRDDDTLVEEGTSAPFSLYPEELDHFTFSGIPSNVEAGDQFPIAITALDEYNNTAAGFASTAVLSDATGTLSIAGGGGNTTTNFTSGVWNGNIRITQTRTSNSITATSGSKTSASGTFSVDPTDLGYFTFDAVSSPQSADTPFGVQITAYDDLDNVKTDYAGTVNLSDETGFLSITSNGSGNTTHAFSSGVWSGDVQITRTSTDNYITASGGGRSGQSGQFNIRPAAASTFTFSTIVDQEVGEPFLITITARDPYNNAATGFTSAATLSDLTGTLQIRDNGAGVTTNAFTDGVWNGNVDINQIRATNQISAVSGAVSGSSNQFRVDSTSTVDHFDVTIASIGTPKTAGVPFSVTIEAIDAFGNTADFSGSVTLFDETDTNSPQQVTINNGVWAGSVTVTRARSGNTLTVTGAGEGGVSGSFNVQANTVASFEIDPIASPQRAGGFSIHMTAYDTYGNIATGFNQTVSLEVLATETIAISPAASGAFSSGQRTQTVQITQAAQDLQIRVEDAGGHEGSSNLFNVIHNATLAGFEIGPVATQAAGRPFTVSVAAVDPHGNTFKAFDGSGDRVTIGHTGSGNISPTVSGGFDEGKWVGNIIIDEVQSGDVLNVVRDGGFENGQSNPFDVTPGVVSYFEFDPIPDPITAGDPFQIWVRAYDAQGNLVTGPQGSFVINLIDETGSILDDTGAQTVSQISLIGGVGTEEIQIRKSIDNNTLTASGQGKSGISNEFDVDPASVDHFAVGVIGSPQFATQSFAVTLTAKDAFENTVDDYTDSVYLADSTGTIQPTQSGNFISGVRTVSVQITEARNDVRIRAYLGSGEAGESNLFNVLPGPLDHFVFDEIGDQIIRHPFSITITAYDVHDNIKTDFNGSVNLSDETGTVTPTVSPNFVHGVMTGAVTIYADTTDNRITATHEGVSSASDPPFDVVRDPGIQVMNLRALRKDTTTAAGSVTANQDTLWFLFCHVRNMSGSNTRLDSLRLSVIVNNQQRSDFAYTLPLQFLGGGTGILGGGQIDSLLIPISHTGSRTGPAVFQVTAFLKKLDTGATLSDEAVTNLLVQTPAQLFVNEMRIKNPIPGRAEVTRGQEENWSVSVVVTNQGQSAVWMDSASAVTFLDFSIGTEATWEVVRPPLWSGGDWIVEGGATDTLKYIIDRTTDLNSGLCSVDAYIEGIEINTGRRLSENTLDGGSAVVRIEEPASLRILSVENLAPNAPYVNRDQSFSLRVQLRNPGGDAVLSASLAIGQLHSFFPSSRSVGKVSGGETQNIEIPGTAASMEDLDDTFTIHASGTAENTGTTVNDQNPADNTARAVTQIPAFLEILNVTPSTAQLIGGQTDPWTVSVVLRNSGQAAIDLDPPKADSLTFWVGGLQQEDYNVIAPSALSKRGDLSLPGGEIDTLVFRVNTTGTYGGQVGVLASIGGKDRNDLRPLQDTGNAAVNVETEEAFRIIQTQIDAVNVTDAKNGFVNTNQEFDVLVILENGLGNTIRNIDIHLGSNGQSYIADTTAFIGILSPSQKDTVWFDVQAAASENLSGEVFTAVIASAKRDNLTDDAPIGAAFDSTATAIIQTRAELALELSLDPPTGQVSVNQAFTVRAELIKTGSSPLKNDGRVTIRPPDGYGLLSESDTSSISPTQPASWILKAPDDTSSDDIRVILDRYPRDKNTGDLAYVPDNSERISITTIRSLLLAAVSISDPAGAADGVVSSGQNFTVEVSADLFNVTGARARIDLPSEYTTRNNVTQILNPDTATWQITAPQTSHPEETIQVITWGYDDLQPTVEVGRDTTLLPIRTELRADLSLSLEITSPPEAAQYGTVSLGQEFTVRSRVENFGEAMTSGDIEVSLLSLPEGFSTADPMTQMLFADEASWTIQAPDRITQAIASIESRITRIPQDVNTNQPAYISRDYQSVALTLEGATLAVSAFPLPEGSVQELTPGQQNVPFMRLLLKNDGQEGSYDIQIEEMHFHLEDRNGNSVSPSSALSRLQVIDDRTGTVYGGLNQIPSSNPVTVQVSGLIVTVEQKSRNENPIILIRGNVAASGTVPYFQLNLPGPDAVQAVESTTGRIVTATDPTGEAWADMRSMPMRIFDPEREHKLWNSPNPFGESGRETTTVYYYMTEQQAVEFRIFTLVGKLVKTVSVDASDIVPNQVNHWSWDGTNDKGVRVLNGVYHLFMKTEDGTLLKQKIAYVK